MPVTLNHAPQTRFSGTEPAGRTSHSHRHEHASASPLLSDAKPDVFQRKITRQELQNRFLQKKLERTEARLEFLKKATPNELVDKGFTALEKLMGAEYFAAVQTLLKGNPAPALKALDTHEGKLGKIAQVVGQEYGESYEKALNQAIAPAAAELRTMLPMAKVLPVYGPAAFEDAKPAIAKLFEQKAQESELQSKLLAQQAEAFRLLKEKSAPLLDALKEKLEWQK